MLTEMASTHLLVPAPPGPVPFGVHGQSVPQAFAFSQGVLGLQQLTQQLEEPFGTFPVTKAFLRLTSNLLDAGLSDTSLQVPVALL